MFDTELKSDIRTDQVIVYDLNFDFGEDLSLNGTNDLLLVSGLERSKQRVLRRLLTNPGDYIWHPTYGAGLPEYVGQPLSGDLYNQIKSRILSNIFLEDSVSKLPQPVIDLMVITGGLACNIQYTDKDTQQLIVLKFDITNDAFTS